MLYLENEGVLLGRVIPVERPTGAGPRARCMMVGESYLKWQRSPMPVLVPAYRRLCTMSPDNIEGLRAARLTRNERDSWDRMQAWAARDDEVQAARAAVNAAKTKNESIESWERLQAVDPDPDWLTDGVNGVRHLLAGGIRVGPS